MKNPDLRKTVLLYMVLLLAMPSAENLRAQGSAGTGSNIEPRYVGDSPTAGVLHNGIFAIDTDVFQEGGLLVGFSLGLLERVNLGLSYGGSHLIGGNSPVMNPQPGLSLKIRVVEEGGMVPALVLGFDTQGRDGYIKELDRYAIKAPGVYAVASKNYDALGFLSLHGGVNYSLERADGDKDINVFFGAEKTLGPFLSLMLEYNAGLNDNTGNAVGKGRGYCNGVIAGSLGGGLTILVGLKDMFKNGSNLTVANRTLRFEFIRAL